MFSTPPWFYLITSSSIKMLHCKFCFSERAFHAESNELCFSGVRPSYVDQTAGKKAQARNMHENWSCTSLGHKKCNRVRKVQPHTTDGSSCIQSSTQVGRALLVVIEEAVPVVCMKVHITRRSLHLAFSLSFVLVFTVLSVPFCVCKDRQVLSFWLTRYEFPARMKQWNFSMIRNAC